MQLSDIGLQLWTFRDHLGQSLHGVLNTVARLGFSKVELASTCGVDASTFAEALRRYELDAIAAHYGVLRAPDLHDIRDAILNDSQQIAFKTAVVSFPPELESHLECSPARLREEYLAYALNCNTLAAQLTSDGIRLCFHPYDYDMTPLDTTHTGSTGISGLDLILRETDSSTLAVELDSFFVHTARRQLSEIINVCARRVSLIHINDADGSGRHMSVGSGVIDWADTFALIRSNAFVPIVEHDTSEPYTLVERSAVFLSGFLQNVSV